LIVTYHISEALFDGTGLSISLDFPKKNLKDYTSWQHIYCCGVEYNHQFCALNKNKKE
jgi:hypothetical protein